MQWIGRWLLGNTRFERLGIHFDRLGLDLSRREGDPASAEDESSGVLHAIKDRAFDGLLSHQETASICQQLTELFLTHLRLERKDRNPPSEKSSARALLDFHKRQRKHCFKSGFS